MEVVRFCLVVAETRRLRPVRPPCGRPLASICGIIRVAVPLCPFTARLRPPCAQGLGCMEVSTFLTCLSHRSSVFKVRPVEREWIHGAFTFPVGNPPGRRHGRGGWAVPPVRWVPGG